MSVDSRLRGEALGIMCKLDIEKAYDHVNWKFLLKVLAEMRFGERWMRWVGFCIKTVRFSILINGEPARFFPLEKGLRQGDPLSPFLFILTMEGYNNMMRIAVQNRWIKGFIIGRLSGEEMQVCPLAYIRLIRVVFEAVSGLAVNWRKSISN